MKSLKILVLILLFSVGMFGQESIQFLKGSSTGGSQDVTSPAAPTNVLADNWPLGFTPADLNPIVDLLYTDSVTVTNGKVASWVGNGYNFVNETADTTDNPFLTDSSIAFMGGGSRNLAIEDGDTAHNLNPKYRDMSIELWIYPNTAGTAGYIYYKRGGTYPNFCLRTTAAAGVWVQFEYLDGNDADSNATITTYDASPLGDIYNNGWHHVVFSWDRNVGTDIYVDGDLIITEHTAEWTNLQDVNIVNDIYTYVGYNTSFGDLAALRVYYTALTQQNVTDLFTYGKP